MMSFSSHVVTSFHPKDKDTVQEACVALTADGVLKRWRAQGGHLMYKPCGPYGAYVSRKVLSPVVKRSHRDIRDISAELLNIETSNATPSL
jgi:hypothetical protein